MGIKFDKGPLTVERNNHFTKIVNVYIVYDLDVWSRKPANNSKLRIAYLGHLI